MMRLDDAALWLRKSGLAARVNHDDGSISGGSSSSIEGHLEVFHQTFIIYADGPLWRFSVQATHGGEDTDGATQTLDEALDQVLRAYTLR